MTSQFRESHIIAIVDSKLWHTFHDDGFVVTGSWNHFVDLKQQTGDVAEFIDVSIAGLLGELHVVGVDNKKKLWRTIRHTNGSWDHFSEMTQQIGDVGKFTSVSMMASYTGVSLSAVTDDGKLWHTFKNVVQNPNFEHFFDVKQNAGDIGLIYYLEYIHSNTSTNTAKCSL